MKHDPAEVIAREAAFPAMHRQGHAGFVADLKLLRDQHYGEFLRSTAQKFPGVNEVLAAFDDAPPEEFAQAYVLTEDQMAQLRKTRVQKKYLRRFGNIRRSWALLLQYLPELMVKGAPQREVLELSTAHGATLEILRHKGHSVLGSDFPNFLGKNNEHDSRERGVNSFVPGLHRDDHGFVNDAGEAEGWIYQPLIESLGLDVTLFDAGQVPYPFEDRRFDTLISFDAIEHYCHPRDWMKLVDEFTRLARRSVLIVTNPVQEHKLEDADYMAAFYAFQKAMRHYRRDGFECVTAGMYRHQLTVFKLMRTGD
ncbi:class I SAM-dependent methyltransferase [Gemmobacter caeruleus]|uniref:class I SAM-dependent methyltransferase n=1 Tax=Gemmobacter caeruleus TaxID=2595004 RepID=UPI0011EEE3EF|nr:class I SAM-dependent methyltransferase [Gemmobacter caeruleus]